ncbi:MAG: efflux RND transporter periplasmic adaptor subunit [Bacteroidia bacterium]
MRIALQLMLCIALFVSCGKKTIETKAERKDITETVFASGSLEPENKYNLTAQSDGYILDLKFKEGDTVKTAQLLAVIDNKNNSINASSAENLLNIAAQNASPEGPTLKQAVQNMDLLKSRAEQDSLQYVRYLKLFQSNSVSKLELENAKLAAETSRTNYLNALQNYKLARQQTEQQLIQQRSLRDISTVSNDYNDVKAVVGGKVYKKLKEIGDYVRRGDVIAVIGDPAALYTKLSVDETNISKIKPGQEAIIELNTQKGKNYKGKVTEIYPAFDEQTQSFFCKVVFTDPLDFKISGTQLQANIIVAEKKNALVIPKNFLGFGNKVTVKGKGEVNVETGFISNDVVEIKSGITENETLVTDQIK